jgi:hypothetical protein
VAAEDAYELYRDREIPGAGGGAVRDGFHHGCSLQLVGLGHEPGTEAQLEVVDPFAPGIIHVLVRHAAAGIRVHQHARHPLELGEEGRHTWLRLGHLHVRTQALDVPGGQRQIVAQTKIENRLEPNVAIEVTMQVYERECLVDHRYGRIINRLARNGRGGGAPSLLARWRRGLLFDLALDLDRAIRHERRNHRHGGQDRCEHGSHDANRQRELGDDPIALLDDNAADVAFANQLLDLIDELTAFQLNRFTPRAIVGVGHSASTSTACYHFTRVTPCSGCR